MEIQLLRDFYVSVAVKTSDPNVDQEFFNLKKYEIEFLNLMDEKFDIKLPTIVMFFKSFMTYDI